MIKKYLKKIYNIKYKNSKKRMEKIQAMEDFINTEEKVKPEIVYDEDFE